MRSERLVGVIVAVALLFSGGVSAALPVVQDVLPRTTVPGGAAVAYRGGGVPWGNPASAGYDTAVVLRLGYENRYFMPELSDEYVSVVVPTPYFNIALSYNFFGLAAYHEMMAAFSVSGRWGIVSLGVEADYFNYYDAEAVRYRHAFAAQVGVAVDVCRELTLGFRAFNPTFSQIRMYDVPRRLPVIFEVGASYRFYDNFDLLAEVGYSVGNGFQWAVGVEYDIMRSIVAKVGASGADYVLPMVGAGVMFGGFRFDLAVEADFRVGLSIMSNLQYCF